MHKPKVILLVTGFSLTVAGCGGEPTVETVDELSEVTVVEGTAGVDVSGINDGSSETVVSGLGGDFPTDEQVEAAVESGSGQGDTDFLSKRVVHFDYNSSLLTLEAEFVVQAHAQYLVENPDLQIILEGHADERGTREYNLALGEDRAKSVANSMEVRGVSPGRIQIVSYGEERPIALGNDEDSWSQNRRVEILY